MYDEAYSTSSLRGTKHAFSFNFIVCRELVMTVNTPVQERDATCRIVAVTSGCPGARNPSVGEESSDQQVDFQMYSSVLYLELIVVLCHSLVPRPNFSRAPCGRFEK